MEYTPEKITELSGNEIFTYGSNSAGIHGAGAARLALKWGAIYGEDGFNGQTYGISTKDEFIETLPLPEIKKNVDIFVHFATQHPEYKFLVTKIGTGLAGLKIEDIAPMFKGARKLANVVLPKDFCDFNRLPRQPQ